MPTFNFSSYYLNKNLSDVTIVITVPDDEGSLSRREAEQLPGHGIVLANVSSLFKTQIERQTAKETKITLDVQLDQVAAARDLVRYVYTGILPDYVQCSDQEPLLVHMLHLAHRYKVQDCVGACLDALLATQQLQPETVHLVYSLLAEATNLPHFGPLMEHCGNHLNQQFGNLEATMSDTELLDKLHKLPHAALLALLEDDRTEAAAENTVLAAVQSWLAHQPERVHLQQRQQLAGAVRIPQLEPMYLATVLPRIPWLVEVRLCCSTSLPTSILVSAAAPMPAGCVVVIPLNAHRGTKRLEIVAAQVLGPHGLAMAAGAAKGLFDVHASPVLSNPDVCGPLTAAWMKGMRHQPDSCLLGATDPGIRIDWQLPLSTVRQAFNAACTAAAASVARLQEDSAQAAAASRQEDAAATGSGGWRQQGWGTGRGAAMSAAAAAAVSFGANMFRKRKRSSAEDEQQQPAASGASYSMLPGAAEHDDVSSQEDPSRARKHPRSGFAASLQDAVAPISPVPFGAAAAAAAAAIAGAEAAAAAANPSGLDQLEPVAATAAASGQQPPDMHSHSFQGIKAYSPEVTFAGYTWRLVLYFEARAKQQPGVAEQSRAAAAAVNATVIAGSSGRQQGEAAIMRASTIEVVSHGRPHQRQQQHHGLSSTFRFGRSNPRLDPASATGWVQQDLGSLQTPWGSKRGPRSAQHPQPALVGAGIAEEGETPPDHARQAVAAVAAMRLPDDLSPTAHTDHTADDCEAHQQGGVCAGNECSWEWHARLAIEAWPCIALQPGVSVAAFSASLAVQRNTAESAVVAGAAGARAMQVSASIAAAAGGVSGKAPMSQHVRQAQRHRSSSHDACAGANTGLPAAKAARAPRSSSNLIGVEGAEAAAAPAAGRLSARQALAHRVSGGHTRRAAAVAAQLKIAQQQQAGMVLAGSDEQPDPGGEELIIDDSSDADDAADAGPATSGMHGGAAWGSSNDAGTDYDSDDGEGQALAEKENQGTAHTKAAPAGHCKGASRAAAVAGAGSGDSKQDGGSSSRGEWLVRRMPQGRHVKSRKCDQGYSDFFQLTLQQAKWDAEAWRPYVQPGGVLHIRGLIWNVR